MNVTLWLEPGMSLISFFTLLLTSALASTPLQRFLSLHPHYAVSRSRRVEPLLSASTARGRVAGDFGRVRLSPHIMLDVVDLSTTSIQLFIQLLQQIQPLFYDRIVALL